jgi:hypothetical protein
LTFLLCHVALLVLQAAVLIHAAMNSGVGPLTGAELAAVTEGLKVLLLLSNRTAAQGEEAQVSSLLHLNQLLQIRFCWASLHHHQGWVEPACLLAHLFAGLHQHC